MSDSHGLAEVEPECDLSSLASGLCQDSTGSEWDTKLDWPTAKKITQTYRAVWDQFYEWEQESCKADIAGLAVDVPGDDASGLSFRDEENLDFEFMTPGEGSSDAMEVDYSDSFSFTIHNLEMSSAITSTCSEKRLKHDPACPRYFACTPTDGNITHTENFNIARFIAHDGEPGFDVYEYMELKPESLKWQDSWVDPDGIRLLLSSAES